MGEFRAFSAVFENTDFRMSSFLLNIQSEKESNNNEEEKGM
jgi:hypothetical protein